jgi:hypothetical protein
MITINVDANKLKNKLEAYGKQAPFIISHALNKTIVAIRKDQVKQIPKHLDKANAYTRSSPRFTRSKKKDLNTLLYFNMATHGFMEGVLKGARISPKAGSKRLVAPMKPAQTSKGRMKNYDYGKGKSSYIKQKLPLKTRGGQSRFFIGVPKHKSGDNYLGLWERQNFVKKGKGKKTKAVSTKLMMHVSMRQKSRFDKKKFPSGEIASQMFMSRIHRQIAASTRLALRTMKK